MTRTFPEIPRPGRMLMIVLWGYRGGCHPQTPTSEECRRTKKGRPRGGSGEGSGQALTLIPGKSNGAQFARFLRSHPGKKIIIFAFFWPFRVPDG